jgi:hypothetical protein
LLLSGKVNDLLPYGNICLFNKDKAEQYYRSVTQNPRSWAGKAPAPQYLGYNNLVPSTFGAEPIVNGGADRDTDLYRLSQFGQAKAGSFLGFFLRSSMTPSASRLDYPSPVVMEQANDVAHVQLLVDKEVANLDRMGALEI